MLDNRQNNTKICKSKQEPWNWHKAIVDKVNLRKWANWLALTFWLQNWNHVYKATDWTNYHWVFVCLFQHPVNRHRSRITHYFNWIASIASVEFMVAHHLAWHMAIKWRWWRRRKRNRRWKMNNEQLWKFIDSSSVHDWRFDWVALRKRIISCFMILINHSGKLMMAAVSRWNEYDFRWMDALIADDTHWWLSQSICQRWNGNADQIIHNGKSVWWRQCGCCDKVNRLVANSNLRREQSTQRILLRRNEARI